MIKSGLKLFLRYWVPLCSYALLILYLSSRPSTTLPQWNIPDKILHAAEYSLFGFLLVRLFLRDLGWEKRRTLIAAVVALAIFGLFDEILQSFVPSRQASIFDWMADLIGGLLGGFAYCLIRQLWDKLR